MDYESLLEWADLHGETYREYDYEADAEEEDYRERQAEMDEELLWNEF